MNLEYYSEEIKDATDVRYATIQVKMTAARAFKCEDLRQVSRGGGHGQFWVITRMAL